MLVITIVIIVIYRCASQRDADAQAQGGTQATHAWSRICLSQHLLCRFGVQPLVQQQGCNTLLYKLVNST